MSTTNAAYERAPESWVGKPVTFTLAHEGRAPRWIGRLAAVRDTGVVVSFDDPDHRMGNPVFIAWGALGTLSLEKQHGEQ